MKKLLFITVLMVNAIFAAKAQLKVTSEGNVGIAISTPIPYADLSVSNNDGYNYSSYSFGIRSERRSSSTFNIGVAGRALNTIIEHRAIGLQGVAGNGSNGWNFGVIGGLINLTDKGAGIFGTLQYHTGKYINGRYAGYFDGETYVDGNITATSFITPSDMRLKENVESVSEITKEGSTLENVLNMNVIKYNYIDREKLLPQSDTAMVVKEWEDASKVTAKHYGLSAQELQKMYPDLVKEGQDGYLAVNYVELVPILIRSIQELKAEVDELKSNTKVLNTDNAGVRIYDTAGKMLRKKIQ